MGSQQSAETMPQNPLIKKIAESLYLIPTKENMTFSLAHRHFAIEFARIQKTKFDRSMNPFCPLIIKQSDKVTTCCLITPMLAIISGHEIKNKSHTNRKFQVQCELLPVYKRIEVKIQSEDAYVVGQGNVGLLFLESPYWRVGWSGVSYISNIQQLQKLELKIVCHPQKAFNKEQNKTVYIQQVRRLKIPKMSQLDSNFCSQANGVPGSIVCKLVDKKPYVIGVQISETQIKFIDQQLFKKMQEKCKEYIRERGEREILKEMDFYSDQVWDRLWVEILDNCK